MLRTCSDYMHSPVVRQTGGGWEEGGKLEFSMAEGKGRGRQVDLQQGGRTGVVRARLLGADCGDPTT